MSTLLPGLRRLADTSSLRTDVAGGLTVGAMLVPQGMAYAELAGMPPIAGCYAALLPLLTYAFLGSSRHLGVGPEPGTAILAATGVGVLAGGDPIRYGALMGALALLVGALSLLGWGLRLGFLAELLSKPVLVGYITGVGLTLLASQIGKATALGIAADGPVGQVVELLGRLDEVHVVTLLLFTATVAVQLALRRWAPKLPGALLAVAGATLASVALDLPAAGVAVVGELPGSLPVPSVPDVSGADLRALLPTALGVALVGYTDNVLTGRAIGAKLGYRIDAGQELLALGVANLGAGVLQGFPVSSSASRSAVPASLGTHSPWLHLVSLAALVGALIVLQPALAAMPVAALAAVIVVAGLMILDVAGFRRLWRVSRRELALAVLTAVAVMGIDVLVGVLIAVAASVLLALHRIAVPHDSVLTDSEDLDGWVDAEQYGLAPRHEGLLVYRFDAPLFFANATRFRERLRQMLEEKPGEERWVVLDFEGIGDVDASALEMLEELVEELGRDGVELAVARANVVAGARLEAYGLLQPEGPVHRHATILGAVRATGLVPRG
jgi:high affinity sulfate transporter 1